MTIIDPILIQIFCSEELQSGKLSKEKAQVAVNDIAEAQNKLQELVQMLWPIAYPK